jgi:outer membrane protein OmpA-like peptidoglycan-associated protein
MTTTVNNRVVRSLKDCWRPGTLSLALALSVGQLTAGPLVKQVRSADGQPPIAGSASGSMKLPNDRGAIAASSSFDELGKALADGRAMLEELERVLSTVTALGEELATARGENQRLAAEAQASRSAHQRAGEVSRARIAELSHALDETEARDEQRVQELTELREANAALTTDLTRLSTQRDEAQAKTEHVRADLTARTAQLMADAESNVAKAQRLEEKLAHAQESLAIASDARSKAEAGAARLQTALDGMSSEAALLREQLTTMAERLNKTEGALALSEQKRKELIGQLGARQAEADRLEGQLATARQELAEREAAASGLEDRLASFETAAAEATHEATQTLHAVETQLASITSVLSIGEEKGLTKVETASTDQDRQAEPLSARPNRPIADAELRNSAPAAGPNQATAGRPAMLVLPGRATKPKDGIAANLPIERQIHAENLLLLLEAQPGSEGIKMILPGKELFLSNSDAVEDAAHARLALIAELLQLYEQRHILILGHTDAVGDQRDNMELSERRAEAVQQFLIDYFDIEASRLSSRGLGENLPIASNATANGREANRRVEVLILN